MLDSSIATASEAHKDVLSKASQADAPSLGDLIMGEVNGIEVPTLDAQLAALISDPDSLTGKALAAKLSEKRSDPLAEKLGAAGYLAYIQSVINSHEETLLTAQEGD